MSTPDPFLEKSCVVLVGSEDLIKSAWRTRLLTELGDGAAMNFHDFDLGPGDAVEAVLMAARTLPMMAPFRLVWVRLRQREKSSEAWQQIKQLVPALSRKVRLVVDVASLTEAERRELAASAEIVQTEAPAQHELPSYLEKQATRRGARLEKSAARLLADLVGSDLGRLNVELEKLCLFVGDGGVISENDVEGMLVRARSFDIFEMFDQIVSGQRARALVVLGKILADSDSRSGHLYVLSMLYWHCKRLLLAGMMLKARQPQMQIKKKLNIWKNDEAFFRVARSYPPKALVRLINDIRRTDLRLKRTRDDPRAALERLLVRAFLYGAPTEPRP